MCGIAGIVGIGSAGEDHPISDMTDSLSHRGPDAKGVYTDDGIALGHTRLSIIDLSAASNQPLWDTSGRYVIVFNGELYNYQQLKSQLSDYSFKTRSDTEVVLAAYIKWQHRCLDRFNGMFAIAIYDTADSTVFLARDRMGIKPLYYSLQGERLVFASEIRSILKSNLVDRKIDLAGMSEFMTYQSIKAPRTIVKGIKQLPPGHYATFRKRTLEIKGYWDFTEKYESNEISFNESKSKVRELLYESVERRMISDVPLGAFLSGGIDSSAIVSIMSEISHNPVNTFSVVFDEAEFDESEYSGIIANKFNTDHHRVLLRPNDLLDELPHALSAMDSPSGDGINTYIISKATKASGLTVALSGLGGDELFAGYPIFTQLSRLSSSMIWNLSGVQRKLIAPIIALGLDIHKRKRFKELLNLRHYELKDFYPIFRKINTLSELKYMGISALQEDDYYIGQLNKMGAFPDNSMISKISACEFSSYMQPVLLKDTDQMSMSHALEVRVPFLDHRLVEFVLGLPDAHKSGSNPKHLLTESLHQNLPDEIINRPKKGFAFPWDKWLRNELNTFCNEHVRSLYNHVDLDQKAIESMLTGYSKGDKRIHWSRIWLMTVLGYWIGKNLECQKSHSY